MTTKHNAAKSVRYERIVVPLDLSELAERAMPHAVAVAEATGAPIHLIHVVDVTPLTRLSAVGMGIEQAAVLAALEVIEVESAAAEDYLRSMRERLAARRLTATCSVVTGLVESALLDAIQPGDLVVMSTHGRTGLERWLMGSVAEAVLRRSSAPVLLVRPTFAAAKENDAARAVA
jgi:nucleotide-binding universal stress UspA family protein